MSGRLFLVAIVLVAAVATVSTPAAQQRAANPNLLRFCPGSGIPCVEITREAYDRGHDQLDMTGFLEARDLKDGKLVWRWDAIPRPREPGSDTWPNKEIMAHGGGATWVQGVYDPQLNLTYWGTGNPHPILHRSNLEEYDRSVFVTLTIRRR